MQKRTKSNKKKGQSSQLGKYVSPFPSHRVATFKYNEERNLAESAGGGDFQVLDLGSLFDPDYTGVGHQPLYFDQLVTSAGPYRRYRVFSGSVHLQFVNQSTTVPATVFAYLAPYVTTPSSRVQALEKPLVKWKTLMPIGSGNSTATIVMKYNSGHVVGVTDSEFMTEDDYAGGYGNSPALSAKCVSGIYGLGANANAFLLFTLVMNARLFDQGNETVS